MVHATANEIRAGSDRRWPAIPLEQWQPTESTLHMVSQMLGKLRLALAPAEPHWTHVPLAVTVTGLATGALPTPAGTAVEVAVDLPAGRVSAADSAGDLVAFPLDGRSVADVYGELVGTLAAFGVAADRLNPRPQEVAEPVPFGDQTTPVAYDHEHAARFHQTLLSAGAVLAQERGRYAGPRGPVGLYWGSFDLAYNRFSGRPAAPPEGAGVISAEALNAEYFCCGFWPGDARYPQPGFFAYTYPRPRGLAEAPVRPAAAEWDDALGEFLLPYDAVRAADDPAEAVRAFARSTFDAGAVLGDWPRWANGHPR